MEFLDLYNSLISKAAKWDTLGLQLGLSSDELDIIRADADGVEERLMKVLRKWYDKTPHPSWEAVVAALKSPALDEIKLAEELRRKCVIAPSARVSSSISRESEASEADDDVPAGVVKENEIRIKGSFATLVRRVTEKLEKREINLKGFYIYILNLFPPGEFIPSSVVSMAEIFESISRHQLWDYSHYTPIEAIAKEFGGDDPELNGFVKSYKAELAGYKATTKIIDYIKVCNDEEIADPEESLHMARYDRRYCNKLTVKLRARITEKSLDYIDQLWRSIAEYFYLPSLSVLLDTVRKGCIEVTWRVPTLSAMQIQANILDSREFLRKQSIIRVALDEEILYDENLHDDQEDLDTKLLKACEKGEVDEVMALLTHGLSVDMTTPSEGMTPLLVAARAGRVDIVDFLLDNCANTDLADKDGYTPLIVATLNGHLAVVRSLLEHGANINSVAGDGWTAILAACYTGNLEITKVLLQYNASLNAHGKVHYSPLMHAIELKKENVAMVELLLEAGALVDQETLNGWCPLTLACNKGYFNVARLLIEHGANVNIWGEDEEGFGWTPLIVAANGGYVEICQLLLENGSVVDLPQKGDGATPLIMACRRGTLEVVNLLLKHDANVHAQCKNGIMAMHVSCQEGYLDIIKALREYGASLEVTSQNGCTPLMSACTENNLTVVQYLLEEMPSLLNAQSESGWTAVMFACDGGYLEVVAELLSRGADPELCTLQSGLSSLIIATNKGHLEIVKLLLEAKVPVNYTEKSKGWSAMFFAARSGKVDLVKVLLSHGADMSLTAEGSDITAYDVASIHGERGVCTEMEVHGYESLAPPTEMMRREVALSDQILTRNLDMENIQTFRDVLRNPRGARDNKQASGTGSSDTPTNPWQDTPTNPWQDAS